MGRCASQSTQKDTRVSTRHSCIRVFSNKNEEGLRTRHIYSVSTRTYYTSVVLHLEIRKMPPKNGSPTSHTFSARLIAFGWVSFNVHVYHSKTDRFPVQHFGQYYYNDATGFQGVSSVFLGNMYSKAERKLLECNYIFLI
jgi:hypothetical protein